MNSSSSPSRDPGKGGPRHSTVFISATLTLSTLLGLCLVHAGLAAGKDAPAAARRASTVRALGLTDLCLFPDAPYTRHLALANREAPFQEHPLALEHFPAGSFTGPPEAAAR